MPGDNPRNSFPEYLLDLHPGRMLFWQTDDRLVQSVKDYFEIQDNHIHHAVVMKKEVE